MLHHVGSINVKASTVPGQEKDPILHIGSLGHAALVFVNKKLVGVCSKNYKGRRFSSSSLSLSGIPSRFTFH